MIYSKTNMANMPGSCAECKLGNKSGRVGDIKCRALERYFTGNLKPPHKERPDECPLIELSNNFGKEPKEANDAG